MLFPYTFFPKKYNVFRDIVFFSLTTQAETFASRGSKGVSTGHDRFSERHLTNFAGKVVAMKQIRLDHEEEGVQIAELAAVLAA